MAGLRNAFGISFFFKTLPKTLINRFKLHPTVELKCIRTFATDVNQPAVKQEEKEEKTISPTIKKLMEFFDDKKNWGEESVKVGRSWKNDELRLKSNTDLHKLWYVLLKEKNMLLTMEEESNRQVKLFPSPERIDKVNESMKRLEDVVKERNEAYYRLETGESSLRPGKLVRNALGLHYYYRFGEHAIPKFMNVKWREKHKFYKGGHAVGKFLNLMGEQAYLRKKRQRNRDFNHVCGLIKRFPNLDLDAVRQEFPDVDIDKALRSPRSRGHYEPK